MNHIFEDKKKTPVTARYDLVVCGGGPAGVTAAITAARRGVKTLLLEAQGCLGGIWTSGLLSIIQDGGYKNGFLQELNQQLEQRDGYLLQSSGKSAAYDGRKDNTYDIEVMKLLLEELSLAAGVTVLLYTRVVAAVTEKQKLSAIITESVSGRQAFAADMFIDCTGNGDLAAYAGNSFDIGHPVTGKTQPATLMALISGFPPDSESTLSDAKKDAFLQAFQKAGFEPSYRKPSLFRLPNPLLSCIMINHEYDVPCDSAAELSKATIRARREINQALAALRTVAGWEKVRLLASAPHIGIREGRRIHGLFQVKADDMIQGRKFPDGICLVEYPVDIHALDRSEKSTYRAGIVSRPYHIPYRSLVAKDYENLALAGRCISGDFYAHASYRVTGNAVPMGEAAGIAAALALQDKSSFHAVAGQTVQHELVLAGHRL